MKRTIRYGLVLSWSLLTIAAPQLAHAWDDDFDGFFDANDPNHPGEGDDCNDQDASINPAAEEVCDNVDNNCDGQIDENCGLMCDGVQNVDDDCDGFMENSGDCNDTDAAINPEAVEVCGNGVDENCNGNDDDACPPSDSNGNGDNNGDGDSDGNGDDGEDGDSDGDGDDDLNVDNDGDGFTENQGDCDDTSPLVVPLPGEICGDGLDNDCNGQMDEGCPPSDSGTLSSDDKDNNAAPMSEASFDSGCTLSAN